MGVTQEKRIKYARDVLQKHFLPHISTSEKYELRKVGDHRCGTPIPRPKRAVMQAFFLGYMVNKLLSTVLNRRPPDDRDHYGNKR